MSADKQSKVPKNNLPGVRSEITVNALKRWNPDIRQAVNSASDNAISILDPIGDYYGEGVTAKRIGAALRRIGDGDAVVNINSPGGDYFEGLAIYNMLREHPGNVTVRILGMAASAASIIAMAGDHIQIARASFIMIHNTWVMAVGDQHAFREVADWLLPFDAASVDIYHARTSLPKPDLTTMLDRETWIGGSAAVDQGFADDLLASDEVDEGANAKSDMSPQAAQRKIGALLARNQDVSRSEFRQMMSALKGGKPGAAPTGMQDAAASAGAATLLEKVKSI